MTPKGTKNTPAASKERASKSLDFSYTQNRELSWLQFDNRVLDEGREESVPLLERFKMASIFESNLDEFFMIRVGGLSELAALKQQPIDNKSNQSPSEQMSAIYDALPPLIEKHQQTVETIEEALASKGLTRVAWNEYTEADVNVVEKYFGNTVLPIVSPQIIDPRHPFPNLRNCALYAVFNLASADEAQILGLIEIPPTLPRIVPLSKGTSSLRYTLLEDVILSCAPELFGEYHTSERAIIRVTRNADIDPDEGSFDVEEDYREHIKKILKRRLRLNPVRLELQGKFSKALVKQMRKSLSLSDNQVFNVRTPMNMGEFAFSLEGTVPRGMAEELCYIPFSPQASARVEAGVPMHEQIRDHDILLFYPYESMDPFIRLLHESANDPEVMQIRITLYRVAKKSKLCESLITAAENGIDVTVLMELRARFDEENNIEWAERLEDAGCTVLYGAEGFKVHSKICQITRRCGNEVVRITQLGTGNYNEKTARLYSDYSLMTADPRIGEDANRFFRNLSIGNLNGQYQYLGVAPVGLKPLIMRGLNREIAKARAGEPAECFFKMNSITDREVIDKISEASCAGVKVNMIVRGISCLLPGVPGKTENVHIRQIVGRMLEHARVYAFGTEHDTIYLSSADMMTRNTEHRVEIAYPLLDPIIRDQVWEDMCIQWSDNVKARELKPNGLYERIPVDGSVARVDSQNTFMQRALHDALAAERQAAQEALERRHRIIPTGSLTPHGGVPIDEAGSDEATTPVLSPTASVTTTDDNARDAIEQAPAAMIKAFSNNTSAVSHETLDNAGDTPVAEVRQTAEVQQASEDKTSGDTVSECADAGDSPADIAGGLPKASSPVEIREVETAQPASTPAPEPVVSPLPSAIDSTPVEQVVDAHTIPATDDAPSPDDQLIETSKAIQLMVRQNGRTTTAWALIKAGFKLLFSGKVS